MLKPKYCLLDFEEALAEGFHKTFPDVIIFKDYFHFKQANMRQLKSLGLKQWCSKVSTQLSALWDKSSKPEFDVCLKELLTEWGINIPKFKGYFQDTWLNRHPPEDWASYARPDNVPSGNISPFCLYTHDFFNILAQGQE